MTNLFATIGAAAVATLGLALAGCGSDTATETATTTTESTTQAQTTTETPTSSSAQAAGPNYTIVDYIKDNDIVETPVQRGDPGAPTVDLPFPDGWEDAGARTPEWAWGEIVYTGPATASDPPTIVALMSKLTGDVDPAKILEYAPGELQNLPGFEGSGDGSASTLGGFDAWQIGGTYVRDGNRRAIAQKTVIIPGQDGLYVLQLNADGLEDHMDVLMDATATIDDQTTITP